MAMLIIVNKSFASCSITIASHPKPHLGVVANAFAKSSFELLLAQLIVQPEAVKSIQVVSVPSVAFSRFCFFAYSNLKFSKAFP